jgi:RimJ/RimL family protein N-acetyltransferase
MASELRTRRLVLRRWAPAYAEPMAAINGDPEVARYLNRPIDEAAIRGFQALVERHWKEHGFGWWGVEVDDGGPLHGRFIGFAGLAYPPPFLAGVQGRLELGWRLARASWGHGYATEAALVARDHALSQLGATNLMSIIHPDNERSQRVARKLGMGVASQIHNPLLGRDVDVWELTSRQEPSGP